MTNFVRFIFGYIKFTACGGFCERFINLCRINGIKLWNMQTKSDVLTAETSIAGFRKIRECAKKSGMRVKLVEKRGLPFIYSGISRRTGLIIGAAAVCFCLLFYSRSVWVIDVSGNKEVSRTRIVEMLATRGVKAGTFKKDIDTKKLRLEIYEEMPEIAWVNLNLDGSRLNVDIRETTDKPKNKDSAGICNIVALKDGIIDRVTVYEGQNETVIGEGVVKGQLLVSGVVYHESAKKTTFHRSRADIFAYTTAKTTIKINKRQKRIYYTGKQRILKEIQIFRLRIPLYIFTNEYKRCEISVINKPLTLNGETLPVNLSEYMVRETASENYKCDKRNAQTLVRPKRRAFENSFAKGTKILKTQEKVQEKEDCFVFTYTYKLYENIAGKAEIEIDDKNLNNKVENDE